MKMIIDRENEIKNFKPEEYWSIETEIMKEKELFDGFFYGVEGKKVEIKNEEEVKEILGTIKGKNFMIDKVNKCERKRNPTLHFTTSSIQQEDAKKLNIGAKKTMMIAQK